MNRFDLFGNPITDVNINTHFTEEDDTFSAPLTDIGQGVEEDAAGSRSFTGLGVLVILSLGVLGIQCFNLQITHGSTNRAEAEKNSISILTIQPDRGLITDRNGVVLAQNTRQLALAINPQTLPTKKVDRQKVYDLLKNKAGITDDTIKIIEENRLKSPEVFSIKTHLTQDESLLYKEWFSETPGVVIQEAPIRSYADLPSLGQIVGYVGQPSESEVTSKQYQLNQLVGKTGIESVYNSELFGTEGKQKAEVDAFGEIVHILPESGDTQAKPGQTLKLSIDSRLQKIVADALTHELERRTTKLGKMESMGASAVVLDPSTGAVLAMVSLPDYNANLFAKGISSKDYQSLIANPANPLLNRTTQGQYPSGSVIKPLIAGAALQDKIVTPDYSVYTPESLYIGQYRFPDWKLHGQTNIRKAIAESNDIFFYALGGGWPEKNIKGLGIERLNAYLRQFGLGGKTGIDLPGEADGLLPTPEWKQQQVGEPWYIGDTYHSSIGQGYTLVTPLQMATSTAAVANGGTVWQPQLGWSLTDPNTGKETLLPHKSTNNQFISSQNIEVVREGMRQTVLTGSARPLNTLKVTSAGKTGTAEFGTNNQTHAWYTGFAPYDNPQIVFSIMIEAGGESFYSSVPVAEEILRGYFNEPLAPGQKLSADTGIGLSEFQGEH